MEDAAITAGDGTPLRGWLVRPAKANGDAVLLLHGVADNRLGMGGFAEILARRGFLVVMPDARAHGESGGRISTYGVVERDDVRRWVDWITEQHRPGCVYGLGESMGAAVLLQSLEREQRFCAIVAESSFSTFREIAYDRVGQAFGTGPWIGRTIFRPTIELAFLYARLRSGFDLADASPSDAIVNTRTPVLLIHGDVDVNIPMRHSEALARVAPTAKLWRVPGAGHGGASIAAGEEFTARLLAAFARKAREERAQ